MAINGLMCSITIGVNHILIAGLHRLQAARLLGWKEIECAVLDLDDLQAQLAEIDENVLRKDLSGIDFGELLLRRKELYEAIHPETKHGGDRKSEKIKTTKCRFDSAKPFAEDTADKMGVTKRTVERQVSAAKKITPEAKDIIRSSGTSLSKKGAMRLSRLEPDDQREAAIQLSRGIIKSISEYRPDKSYDEPDSNKSSLSNASSTTQKADIEEPFTIVRKQFEGFDDSLADLKNPDKDFSCTAESFLDEFMCLAQKIKRDIDWYQDPYYQETLCSLSKQHLIFLREQVDAICSSARTFYKSVERKSKNELSKKALSAKAGEADAADLVQ